MRTISLKSAVVIGCLVLGGLGEAQQTKPASPSGSSTDSPPVKEADVVYLDDLQEIKYEVGYAKLGKHGLTTYDAKQPQKFRLNGATVKHSLGMVPLDKGVGYAIYNLDGRYNRFRGTAAINTAVKGDGLEEMKNYNTYNRAARNPVTFRVVGDGKVLWESQPLQKHGSSQDCDIAIAGVKELRVEACCTAEINFAWTFWANPRVFNVSVPDTVPVDVATAPANSKPEVEANSLYLDDLKEIKLEIKNSKLGTHGATGFPPPYMQKCRLNGQVLKHALALHPSVEGSTNVTYNVLGRFESFRATVALNVPTEDDGLAVAKQGGYEGKSGPVTFRVFGDGKVLWESRNVENHGESQDCDVAITGVKELRLDISCAGTANYAWAFWGNPRVFGTLPVRIEELTAPSTSPEPSKTAPGTSVARADEADTMTFAPLDLPDRVTFMAATEDGQYLVCSHYEANKVTVWDVAAGKVFKALNVTGPRCVLCRGDSVFVAHATEGKIRCFSRKANWTLVDEYAVKKSPIHNLSAPQGEFFKGDILVTCHGPASGIILLDTAKDKGVDVSGGTLATVSYNGKLVMNQSSFMNSPAGTFEIYAYTDYLGGKPRAVHAGGELQNPYIYQAQPGNYWFGAGTVFGGAHVQKLAPPTGDLAICDATQPIFYSLSATQIRVQRLNSTLSEIARRPVAWTAKPEESSAGVFDVRERHRKYLLDVPYALTLDKKLHLFVINHPRGVVWSTATAPFAVPADSVAGATPATATATGAEPSDTNEHGLPARIAGGRAFAVKMKGPANTEYELMSGPMGLKLSKAGAVTWTPNKDDTGSHELKIRIKSGSDISIVRHTIEVVDGELVAKSGGSLADVDKGQRLALDVDHCQIIPGPGYKSLLLLQGDHLRVLGPDGMKVIAERTLPKRYIQLAARQGKGDADTYVGLVNEPPQLDLIDAKSGKIRKSVPIQKSDVRILELVDIAVHPHQPITYVTVMHDIELPRYRILVVDESTGKVDAPENTNGTWLKIDPTGKFLYAAYRDLYTKGVKFHMNPGWNLIKTPEYGNVDWLISYEVHGQKLKLAQVNSEAGGNGSGIVLSPDGKRITYLSHVGTPMHSKNLVGWNPANLKEEPVTYPTKDRAGTKMLAFHPTLNLVATYGGTSAVLFDRESGKILEDKLQITAKGLGGANVEQLQFAPDGNSLLFVCTDLESGRYLRKVELRLTAAERATAAKSSAKAAR